MSLGLHHSFLRKVWNVCVIGYDYQGANSFRKVCIIVRNLRLLLLNFLVGESEWVDTVIAEQSPHPSLKFLPFWTHIWALNGMLLFNLVMSILLFYVDNVWLFLCWSAYRIGNWLGLSCTCAGEFM